MRIPRCGREGGSARRGPSESEGAGGAHLCGPPIAARPLARDSLRSPRNLGALRVWQRCLQKGSTEAARSCSSPSESPAPAPSPSPPPSSDGARGRPPAAANLERPPGPSGKKLGSIGTGGSIPFSFLESGSCQGVWILRGRRKELAGFGESSSGPGENLPQCLEQGLQRGWRRRVP